MTHRTCFSRMIDNLNAEILADGVVEMKETAWILRAIRPFALRGDARAIKLAALVDRVRADGIITPEESREVRDGLLAVSSCALRLEEYVREIPDFPKPGVLFRDVTGILDNADGFRLALYMMECTLAGTAVDLVAAPESRGFIFGSALAARLGVAFAPIRKPGKLPRETVSVDYALEYGTATLHMHKDAVTPGERVVLVDDLLATGGTAAAGAALVERLGGRVVKMIFPIELEGFGARKGVLAKYDVSSLIHYPGR